MDTNMTFRMDSEVKAQMAAICDALGMSTSTAFNIFANAFVRAKSAVFHRIRPSAEARLAYFSTNCESYKTFLTGELLF